MQNINNFSSHKTTFRAGLTNQIKNEINNIDFKVNLWKRKHSQYPKLILTSIEN